jgi:hypothetical protein
MSTLSRRRMLVNTSLWTLSAATAVRATVRASAVRSLIGADEITENERAEMRAVAEGLRVKYGIPGLSIAIADTDGWSTWRHSACRIATPARPS